MSLYEVKRARPAFCYMKKYSGFVDINLISMIKTREDVFREKCFMFLKFCSGKINIKIQICSQKYPIKFVHLLCFF